MSSANKFDLSTGSPDRPLYTTGQRGSHLASQLERSSSFRENMENRVLASLPSMSRSSSAIAQGDVANFFQCLRFDPKVVAAEHKSNRQVDFRRHVNIALGMSTEESPIGSSKGKLLPCPIPEEIKRVKAGLRENSVKARERVKIFNEALSVCNKFFPSIPSRKRSRVDVFGNDRSSPSLSSDRPGFGAGIAKMAVQSHPMTNGFELEPQKSEERIKNVVPNKRTRTSLMDLKSNAPVKLSGSVDREREVIRLANNGAGSGEDRTLPIGIDGWEKSKMKKKRTGIKPEVSPNTTSSKPIDGYRESKQGMQQRPLSDVRSRLSSDSHGFRLGVANGSAGVAKSEAITQQTGPGVCSSMPRADMGSGSVLNDRRDLIGADKERINLRAINKTHVRDECNSASPTSNTKINGSVRGPRSGSGVAPKMSPVVHRATAPSDWEVSNCTNKPLGAVGVNNRKRTTPNRSSSSSSSVVHWASQRPQKISRIARRTNLGPIANSDECPSMDPAPEVVGNELGLGIPKRLTGNSPQYVKPKGEPSSSTALSESEESGAAEIKSREKGKKPDETNEKVGQNVQKVSTSTLPSRKNKLASGEDLGDGVRRQGRSGRGISSSRSLVPMTVEKLGNIGTAKQLRSARLGFTKAESKAGRPPTRKLSDRRAYTRQKLATIDAGIDFLVGSEDEHEELLAAVNAMIKTGQAIPNSFWRHMQPIFDFISEADFNFLKQQGDLESILKPNPSTIDGSSFVPDGHGLFKQDGEIGISVEAKSVDLLPEQLLSRGGGHHAVPLYQRLMAALISEEDISDGNGDLQFDQNENIPFDENEGLQLDGNEDVQLDGYQMDFRMDPVLESNGVNHMVNFESARHTAYNGYRMTGRLEDDELGTDGITIRKKGNGSSHFSDAVFSDGAPVPGMTISEAQYDSMEIDEKVYLEAQSIGIFLEPTPEIAQGGESLSEAIDKLNMQYYEKVSKKKGYVDILLNCASEMKVHQEKEFNQRAHEKLVEMAYEKYMTCRAPHPKSSSNKFARLAALSFVKRTLERCKQYEEGGKSCFDDAVFKNIFNAGLTREVDTTKNAAACVGSKPSPLTSQPCQNGDTYSSDLPSPVNCFSAETTVKDDAWSNRIKKRKLLLDDVGGVVGTSPNNLSGERNPLPSSTKGKRSERDREGKGQNREVSSRNGTNKIGRPALSNAKGERKAKTKPKQKTTQLSVSLNGLPVKMPEQPKPSSSKSRETTNSNIKEKKELNMDVLDVPMDLSHLQIPEMGDMGGPDGLDSQEQDLSTWLNIDEDALQDDDFMGLEIPMDDLSDLNMMV